MNKKTVGLVLTFSMWLVLVLPLPKPAVARGASTPVPAPAQAGSLDYLPASDAVVFIDVHSLLNEALPRLFASDPAKMAQAEAEIAKFKTRTGVDPRLFDRVTIGMHYTYPAENSIKVQTVAIARGAFDAKAMVAASRAAAHGKYREENHRGATISVININDRIKLAGLWEMKINDLAICPLDANTIAIGSPATVRAAVEAGKGGVPTNSSLATLTNQYGNALVTFAGNVTPGVLANLHLGDESVAKTAASVKQVFGAFASTDTGFSLTLVARTGNAADAANVSETIEGLRQLGGMLVGKMQPAKKKAAQSALNNMKIVTQGNDVQITTHVASADLGAIAK